jgi:predicted amidohydrolase
MAKDSIFAAALQFPISMNAQSNVQTLKHLLSSLPAHTFAVAPEGALSGYLPEPNFVQRLDHKETHAAIDTIAALCTSKSIHLVAGACVQDHQGLWRNRSIYFGAAGERAYYDKINLAQSERGTFTAAHLLPVFNVRIAGKQMRIAIQMCREIRYPEQWRVLAAPK